MSNEEKAKEIAELCDTCIESSGFPNPGCESCESRGLYYGALEMAEWKDKVFLSIIEDKLNYAREMIKENNGKSVRLKYEGMRKILIEIKNELNVK